MRAVVSLVVVPIAATLLSTGTDHAGLGIGAAVNFPTVVTVGDAGVPASIQLQNNNTLPDTSGTVCNAGDPFPCPGGDPGITLIPSCGQIGLFSACVPAGADPGVFDVSPSGVGEAGTACAGLTFSIDLIDPVFGQLRFTPQPPGSHVVLPSRGSICRIDFTVDVLNMPAIDQNPATAGVQTVQVVDFSESDLVSLTASARGASIGTRVQAAQPAIDSVASSGVVISGALTDQATVSGRVNPVAGATADFRLYGPDDATCAGPPFFESLAVPYPRAGGPVTSAAFTPTTPATYRWIATYNGDANNAPTTGACNGTNENAIVSVAAPAIATIASPTVAVGGALTDQATVSGRVSPLPGATIDFRLYGPNDATCASTPAFQSLAVPYPQGGGPVTSAAFTPTSAGTYRWTAAYSGDANNATAVGSCNGDGETVEVSALSPLPPVPINPTPSPIVPVVPSVPVAPTVPVTPTVPVAPTVPSLPIAGADHGTLFAIASLVTVFGAAMVRSSRRRRSGASPPEHGDVESAVGGEGLFTPTSPALVKAKAGEARHQVELTRPRISAHDRIDGDARCRKRDMTLVERLANRVVAPHIEAHAVDGECLGVDVLVVAQPVKPRRHERFHHEATVGIEMRGHVLETPDLILLRQQVEQRVEDEVHQRIGAGYRDVGEVAHRHRDLTASRFGTQSIDHCSGKINAIDAHAASGERKCDPTSPDGQLQRRST